MFRKSNYKAVDFDEVVSDAAASGLNPLEQPLRPFVFRGVNLAALAAALIFLVTILSLAGVNHNRYLKRAEANANQEIPLIAPRGLITDRHGAPLVENQAIFSVFLQINEMVRNNEKEAVLEVAENTLGLDRNTVLETFENTNFSSIILARDIGREKAIAVKTTGLKSLVVENDYRRNYKDPAFSHTVGYVGLVNGKDLRDNENLVLNDSIGRSGLEAYYDERLRGTNGAISAYRNAKGEVESVSRSKEPVPGENLTTTIDADFQKYFYERLLQGLLNLGRTSGAGVAINPQNGEVLALVSLPSFDANNIALYLDDPYRPLFNRIVSGVYSPGSTIKPVHAVAALNEGVVDPQKRVYSAGYIEIPNPYDSTRPSRFLDWKAHGWVDVYSALARSSNVYFYAVGGGFGDVRGLKINTMRGYWQKFGLDKKTGIDLPGESNGFLPAPEEKEKRTGSPWLLGDTYNVSIGQGDLQISPLELVDAIAAIGYHGKSFVPHLLKDKEPELLTDVSNLEPALKEVRKGMEDAVAQPYGTAHLLGNLPVKVAAKTGSAQIALNTKINALFVGYAPADDPQIAILILVEDAREGSANTVPIARDVLEWYYTNRIAH
ncbi:MAG: hypothetical protein HYY99_00255 [Candidatus Colwellbacteria bacterium]|nr:hypothetical protein [Candidatus Colwellbacteria bacterium]